MEFAIFRLLFIVILVGVDVGTAIYYRYIEEIDTKVFSKRYIHFVIILLFCKFRKCFVL